MKTTLAAATLAAALLAGCMSAGMDVKPDQVKSFQPGKTTRGEIEAALGRPNVVRNKSDGTTEIVYQHVDVRVRGETFIPFIGGLVGGSDVRTNEVSFTLDKSGIFQSTTSATTEQGASLIGSSNYRPPAN
jgi:outer membrane protein assembly factor BamE (lipoprotein component of BamABCDE complex)